MHMWRNLLTSRHTRVGGLTQPSMTRWALVGLLVTAAACADAGLDEPTATTDDALFSNDRMVFLYRATGGSPSWVTAHDTYGTDHIAEPLRSSVSPSSAASQSFYHLGFDGTDYVRGRRRISTDTNDGVTVQAWFRAGRVDRAKQVIFSNTQSAGFTLRLERNRLRGLVRVGGKYMSVTSRRRLTAGRWYRATFRVMLLGRGTENYRWMSRPQVRLTMWIDGDFDSEVVERPRRSPRIVNSRVKPMLGAEPNRDSRPSGWHFNGNIHAVIVRNYPLSASFIDVNPSFDGNGYLGQPSYHDGDHSKAIDERITRFDDSGKVHPVAFVPFTNDEYVVQGVASSCEGRSSCRNERLYMSLYYKATNGGGTNGNPAIIAELDPRRGYRVTRCFRLTGELGNSHVGGLAHYGGRLYVSGEGKIERYPLRASGNGACEDLHADRVWSVKASSFVSYTEVGGRALLVGRFCKDSSNCEYANGSNARPYAYRYPLDAAGNLIHSGDSYDAFTTKYRLPYKAQGVDIAGSKLVVATSYGNRSSHIRRYSLSRANCPRGRSCGGVSEYGRRLTLPAGTEDLAYANGRMWSASESGARHFQKRSSNWTQLYPYVFYSRPHGSSWR